MEKEFALTPEEMAMVRLALTSHGKRLDSDGSNGSDYRELIRKFSANYARINLKDFYG